MTLNEIAECSQTFEEVREELEGLERVLADRLRIPFRQCRLTLLALNRAGQLEEDSVVADWYEAYQSYLNWTRDDSWGRPPPTDNVAKESTPSEAAKSGLAAFCGSLGCGIIYVPARWRFISFRKIAYGASFLA